MVKSNYDVAILGSGLSGLTLALQVLLREPSIRIVVLGKCSFPIPAGSGTVGESTVELASRYFADVLGLKRHMEEEQLPKLGLRYFLECEPGTLIENRLEVGGNKFAYTPSYQVDRASLENYLWREVVSRGAVVMSSATVRDVVINNDESHEVIYQIEGRIEKIDGLRWIVDGSGRASVLKKKLELKSDNLEWGHSGTAAWWKMLGEHKIDDWCPDPAWSMNNQGEHQRWFSTNHLMGEGYWVWLIPLSSNQTSFGIVLDPSIHPFLNTLDKAIEWLNKHEPQAGAYCEKNKHLCKDFGAYKNYSFNCSRVISGDRWALTGEAGLFIDPFYSPGSDFIALSNTYITDLIVRDYNKEGISLRAHLYNELFLKFARSTLNTFRGQYPILGNPLVLPIKVFWDWCFYWRFLARLFFEDKMCDLSFISKNQKRLEELQCLGEEMQSLFREWSTMQRPSAKGGFLDLGKHPYLFKLNRSLSDRDINLSFEDLFENDVCELFKLASEIRIVKSKFMSIGRAKKSESLNSIFMDPLFNDKESIIGPFVRDLGERIERESLFLKTRVSDEVLMDEDMRGLAHV
ncbi:MAG TPA: FAD-dependent monooxygenase [Oligoflexia bacterium]|nr:FAD-dependent monooxygenase [Oligoflexia bacterium]HMP49868.1 FAD-dependent monooxygenase [Oligoflexia bacterium]